MQTKKTKIVNWGRRPAELFSHQSEICRVKVVRENKNIIISSCPELVKYFKIRIVFCISIVKKVGTLHRTCNDLASEMCWCTTERAQVIDNKALSMLGNEISRLLLLLARPAFSCGSPKNPGERTGRAWGDDKRRRNYREITQPEQRQAGQTGGLAKTRGTGGEPGRVIRRE